MVLSQVFSLDNWLVKFTFSHSQSVLHALKLQWEFFVFGNSSFKISAYFLVFGLRFVTLFFDFRSLFFEFLVLLIELFELFVGLGNGLFSDLHLLNEGSVIFFGLKENVVKFGVGGLKLSGLLFELFEGVDWIVQEFVKSFTFVLVFGSLLLKLL